MPGFLSRGCPAWILTGNWKPSSACCHADTLFRAYMRRTATRRWEPNSYPSWTPEENGLLIDMRVKGKTWEEIAAALPGRTVLTIQRTWFRIAPRSEDGRLLHYFGRIPKWTAAEDAILEAAIREKPKRTSLVEVYEKVKETLPMRTVGALAKRYQTAIHPRNKTWQQAQTKAGFLFTSSEVSRIIELKHRGGLLYRETAAELGRSPHSVMEVYLRAVKGGVSTTHADQLAAEDAKMIELRKAKRTTQSIVSEFPERTRGSVKTRLSVLSQRHGLPHQLHRRWSAEEDAKLIKLRNDGLLMRAIAIEIPRRSLSSLEKRVSALREHIKIRSVPNPKKQDETAAIKERLILLRDDRNLSWAEIQAEFPNEKRRTLDSYLTEARKARAADREKARAS